MRFAQALTLLFVASTALHAEPKDVADLFPADMLLYTEVNQPEVVARDLTAFLKGTVFETSAPSFKSFREKQDRNFNTGDDGLLAAILAPEMLKEVARFKGLAGGIVGFTKEGVPEYLFVVLPGDSRLPGFLLRSFVTARVDFRKLTAIEGIDLFQRHAYQYQDDPLLPPGVGGADGPPRKLQPFGPIIVNHAGLLVVGSNMDHVSAVIRRFKDKERSAALTSAAGFKALRDQRAKPGILFLADARRLIEHADRDATSLSWLAFKNLLPPASISTLVARLEISDETIRLRVQVALAEKVYSPLAKLLEGAALSTANLNGIPKDSPLTVTLALPQGEERATRLLAALDAAIRSTGTLGPNASELMQELEEQRLLSKSDLAKVNRVTLALPPVAAWVKDRTPLPVLLVYSDDGVVLGKIEAAVPTILHLLGSAGSDPVTETIRGVKVRSLDARSSPLGRPIHYGIHRNALAIGTDRKETADMLLSLGEQRATPEMAALLKNLDKPALASVWNWVDSARGPKPAKAEISSPRSGIGYGRIPPHWSPSSPYEFQPGPNRFPKEGFARFEGLPPLVLALSSRERELLIDFQQIAPKAVRTKAINYLFDWFGQASANWHPTGIGSTFDGPIDIQPALPPAPLPPLP